MDIVPIEREALTTLDQAREISVTNDEQYKLAGEFIAGCKQLLNKIESEHADTIKRAHESHKAAIALKDSHARPVKDAIDIVSRVAIAWKKIQDLLARQEAERIAAEQRKADEERRFKEAMEAEDRGDSKAVEQLLDTPLPQARMVKFESPVPKIAGLTTRKKWKARIVDPNAVKPFYLRPDDRLIALKVDGAFYKRGEVTPAMIKALEDEIGGVEVYEEENFTGVRGK